MESAPGSRGLGPNELPESLFYLTPPPPGFARKGSGEPALAQLGAAPSAKPRLLVRLREAIRLRGYSPRTEHAYVQWVRRYVVFHGRRHPADMGREQIQAFLSDLTVRGKLSASTQNQALCALVFLYPHVLKAEVGVLDVLNRGGRGVRSPADRLPASTASVPARSSGGGPVLGRPAPRPSSGPPLARGDSDD